MYNKGVHYTTVFTLDNFQGPLQLLLHLVEAGEIDVSVLPVTHLTGQLSQRIQNGAPLDEGSESVFVTSALTFLKSQRLLPRQVTPEDAILEATSAEVVAKLIELAHIRQGVRELEELQEKALLCFGRGLSEEKRPKLELPTLQQLLKLLKKPKRSPAQKRAYQEIGPVWQMKERAAWLMSQIKAKGRLLFHEIFLSAEPKMKRIVTFIALLELMRDGLVTIHEEEGTYAIVG